MLSQQDSLYGLSDTPQRPAEKPTTFDLVTRLLLPLALVGIAILQQQLARFGALIGFAFLSIILSFHRSIKDVSRQLMQSRRDKRVARREFPRLKQFIRQFGEFADGPIRQDTLHEIVLDSICRRNLTDFSTLHLAPADSFTQWCYHLKIRIEIQKPTLTNLLCAIQEFNSLVHCYDRDCVLAIFERFPVERLGLLTNLAESNLEAFRQRFDLFLHNYSEYLKGLDESFTTPRVQSYYFARPKPLVKAGSV